jgi:hypothetical protein
MRELQRWTWFSSQTVLKIPVLMDVEFTAAGMS